MRGRGGTSLGLFFRGGFGIFPTQPLAPDTTYRVVLTGGTVTDEAAHVDYPIAPGTSWCFSTGATYTPSADCSPPSAAAQEPANVNASTLPSLTPARRGPAPARHWVRRPRVPARRHRSRNSDPDRRTTPRTPSAAGSSLTGLRHGHPALTLKLETSAGAAGITAVSLKLPSGLSFAHDDEVAARRPARDVRAHAPGPSPRSSAARC